METARWLMVFSAVALVLGPVVALLGALSASALFMAAALLIMGALGLYAGMRATARKE
jgi:hypothetical protein